MLKCNFSVCGDRREERTACPHQGPALGTTNGARRAEPQNHRKREHLTVLQFTSVGHPWTRNRIEYFRGQQANDSDEPK